MSSLSIFKGEATAHKWRNVSMPGGQLGVIISSALVLHGWISGAHLMGGMRLIELDEPLLKRGRITTSGKAAVQPDLLLDRS
jgi:hypothetical protein